MLKLSREAYEDLRVGMDGTRGKKIQSLRLADLKTMILFYIGGIEIHVKSWTGKN